MSTYQPNIPTGLINLDVDYQNIRNNFTQLNTSFGLNHIQFSVGPNNGKHTFVEMVNSSTIPAGLTSSEGTMYTKLLSGTSQLFYTPDNSGNEFQLTNVSSVQFARFGTNTNYTGTQSGGWTFLPGGLIMQYGSIITTPNGGTATITFPKPFLSQVYNIQLSFNRTDPSSVVQTVRVSNFSSASLSSFNFYSGSNNNTPVFWTAIGK